MIGQDHGIIGHKIKKYNLGITLPIQNTKKVIKKLNNLFNHSKLYLKQSKKNRKLLMKLHSPGNHCELVYKFVKKSYSLNQEEN